MPKHTFLFLLSLLLSFHHCIGQTESKLSFFETPETLHKKRLLAIGITGATTYTASMIALNQFWYKDFEKEPFHTFNDWGEWENMDKYGHAYSAYMQSKLFYHSLRWTGMNSKNAALSAFAFSTLAQTSIEFFDSRSANWGWSWYDVAYNTGGSLLFCVQEFLWQDQILRMKLSYTPVSYSTEPMVNNGQTTTVKDRAEESFGKGAAERIVKDYNAQTIWLSANLKSIVAPKSTKFPTWLNLAVGYGAQGMLGAYGNGWTRGGATFSTGNDKRHKQLYLSLDIDLEKLPIKNKALRGVCKFLNIIKIPSPTMEFNTLGEKQFHLLYF